MSQHEKPRPSGRGAVTDLKEPYGSIIESHLNRRGKRKDDYLYHNLHHAPRYVVRMCEELQEEIAATGGRKVPIKVILRAERTASGHIDCHQKAAFYMDEIARGVGPFSESG